MNRILSLLFALLAGVMLSVQSGVNGALKTRLNSAFLSSAISNFIGALLLLTLTMILQSGEISLGRFSWKDWWLWTGGVLSVLIMLSMVVLPGRIGFSTFFSLFIVGQLIMSMLIDRFGLFNGRRTPINGQEIVGLGLLTIGAILVTRSQS